MRKVLIVGGLVVVVLALAGAGLAYARFWYEPGADTSYDTSVATPALTARAPRVLFDHGHRNIHSIRGRYGPFANLLRADGCRVSQGSGRISAESLAATDILVIVNAKAPGDASRGDAFSDDECGVIEGWVRGGGSLLLVADHHPCGPAVAPLSSRFGVVMTGGWTDDEANARQGSGDPGQLLFSREKGSLGDHAITRGKGKGEQVDLVETFTGQSLVPPEGAAALLPLADSAVDRIPTGSTSATKGGATTTTFTTDDRPAKGHCQGLALRHGAGRVVVLAEAAMLSAQVEKDRRFGMNAPGNDNKQFTLNVVRWLAGALD